MGILNSYLYAHSNCKKITTFDNDVEKNQNNGFDIYDSLTFEEKVLKQMFKY